MSRLIAFVGRHAPFLINWIGKVPALRRLASRAIINRYAYATAPRPRPFSMLDDHVSWRGLTDRTYSGRHLPPAEPRDLPAEADVVDLFRRDGQIDATDTSVLFCFFAQWFTDSFLRTNPRDPRKNDSNHEIDLCQIYGLDPLRTDMLRAKDGGRLRSQMIDGAEFPEFLFKPRAPGAPVEFRDEFRRPEGDLHDERFLIDVILRRAADEAKDHVFATGLEHGNSTIGATLMNVIFLREHNRIAGEIAAAHPDWDDERLFDTTRNVMTVLLLKVVIEDYIKHIAPFDVPLETVPFIADGERWNRSNWIAIEFNLLYRWHMLTPDVIRRDGDLAEIDWAGFGNNNKLVIERGVADLARQMSRSPAGKIGLWNTPAFLFNRFTGEDGVEHPSVEERTISLMRKARLRTYNDYRRAFGFQPVARFAELTSDPKAQARLREMYGSVRDVEWFVGLFAESFEDFNMMGSLLATMVAYDAFTQALTNPLLSANVFNKDTFSSTGMRIIEETSTLAQIAARSSGSGEMSFRLGAI